MSAVGMWAAVAAVWPSPVAAKAAIAGELSARRLLYVLNVGKLWVDRDEELREWVVELAGEEPFVERGKERV